jgi:nucleotide-binding universal stress UspA family protein
MKKILVPTDFSDCAYTAVKTAAQLARRTNGMIRLIHVYDRPVYGFVDLKIDHEQNREMKASIDEKLAQLKLDPVLEGLEIHTTVTWDMQLWEAINDPDYSTYDLVIMGTHGASGFKELFIGSNAEKVVRSSKIPVLTINKAKEVFKAASIVFASNFFREAEDAYAVVEKMRRAFGATVKFLKINTPGNFEATWYSEKLMSDFAKAVGCKDFTCHIYNDETVEKGIMNFCENTPVDVVAIATHGRTGLLHLINGSIAESVVNHFELPVLSIRLKENESPTGVIFPY